MHNKYPKDHTTDAFIHIRKVFLFPLPIHCHSLFVPREIYYRTKQPGQTMSINTGGCGGGFATMTIITNPEMWGRGVVTILKTERIIPQECCYKKGPRHQYPCSCTCKKCSPSNFKIWWNFWFLCEFLLDMLSLTSLMIWTTYFMIMPNILLAIQCRT